MTIYHFERDAKILRDEILPNKKFFVMDAYDTLFLSNLKGKRFLRSGTIDFLRISNQDKIIYTDAENKDILEHLTEFNIQHYFSKVYSKEHVDYGRENTLCKDYESAVIECNYSIDDAIVFEDLNIGDKRFSGHQIDFVVIPQFVLGNY